MKLSLIAAVSENNVIGKDGEIPWYIPEDLKHFKKLTLGHPVIMGRATYESIIERLGHPLKDRKNIFLTGNPDYVEKPGVYLASSMEDALHSCDGLPSFVIGGQSVYEEALPLADTLELTRVHLDVEGDTYFPNIDWKEWRLIAEEKNLVSKNEGIRYSYLTYFRKK